MVEWKKFKAACNERLEGQRLERGGKFPGEAKGGVSRLVGRDQGGQARGLKRREVLAIGVANAQ
jgi:hypothetical protein